MASALEPLVRADWLARELGAADLRVYDCSVWLEPAERGYQVKSGRESYAAGHVPGAGFLDLTGALSDSSSSLNFTCPTPGGLADAFGAAGIGDETRVVLYAASGPMWATRVWWMLRALGFARAAVLDGGLEAWKAAGGALCADPCSPPGPARLTPRPDPRRWASKDEVARSLASGEVCVVNALPRAVHRGEARVNYGRRGHIAGSVNVPYDELLAEGRLDVAGLRDRFARAGVLERPRVIAYCGGGIAATLNAFALELLGHRDVAVYDGSLSEWARDPQAPMATGD
jgi:thiosulfate/3-mercaptopyruvate sulfurtransferase